MKMMTLHSGRSSNTRNILSHSQTTSLQVSSGRPNSIVERVSIGIPPLLSSLSFRLFDGNGISCERDGDVVGVVTPLGVVAQAFHGDQVVELRVQLAVQEVEGKEEDKEGQVEVEEEKRLKEVRSWMTMEMK